MLRGPRYGVLGILTEPPWVSIWRIVLVTLRIYRIEICHGQQTSIDLERDFPLDRNRFSVKNNIILPLSGYKLLRLTDFQPVPRGYAKRPLFPGEE